MAGDQDLFQEQKDVIDAKREILDFREKALSEEVYRNVRTRLLKLGGSILGTATAILGLLAIFGIGDLIASQATRAVDPSIERAEEALRRAEVLIAVQAENLNRLKGEGLELADTLEEVEGAVGDLQELADTQQFLTQERLDELFQNVLFAASSDTFLCSGDPDGDFGTDLRLHFAREYPTARGLRFQSFPMPGVGRRFDIHTFRGGFEVAPGLSCTRNRGVLDPTDTATPYLTDIRDLARLEAFVLDTVTLVDADGDVVFTDEQATQRLARWQSIDTAVIELRIGGGYTVFTRNAQPMIDEGWFTENEVLRPLNAVSFIDETLPSGRQVRRAIMPIRDPVLLTSLVP